MANLTTWDWSWLKINKVWSRACRNSADYGYCMSHLFLHVTFSLLCWIYGLAASSNRLCNKLMMIRYCHLQHCPCGLHCKFRVCAKNAEVLTAQTFLFSYIFCLILLDCSQSLWQASQIYICRNFQIHTNYISKDFSCSFCRHRLFYKPQPKTQKKILSIFKPPAVWTNYYPYQNFTFVRYWVLISMQW